MPRPIVSLPSNPQETPAHVKLARLDPNWPSRQRPYCSGMRPATAIVILILLALIVIAGAFQLRSILTG